MGRHAADDEAGAHPLVAAALADRGSDSGGVHRHDQGSGEPVGWPGIPDGERLPGGGGLGWPEDPQGGPVA